MPTNTDPNPTAEQQRQNFNELEKAYNKAKKTVEDVAEVVGDVLEFVFVDIFGFGGYEEVLPPHYNEFNEYFNPDNQKDFDLSSGGGTTFFTGQFADSTDSDDGVNDDLEKELGLGQKNTQQSIVVTGDVTYWTTNRKIKLALSVVSVLGIILLIKKGNK